MAIYVAGSTALYAILAEPNSNKIEKQEIYGKLKGIINNDIAILEQREYQNLSFGLWDNIQQDHRYHYFDEKFVQRCDAFLERMRKYSFAINKIDNVILPKIIRDTAKDVFQYKPEQSITLSIILYNTKGEPSNSYSTDLVSCLKTKKSLSDLERKALMSLDIKEAEIRETGLELQYLKAYEPLNVYRQELEKKSDYSQSKIKTSNPEFIGIFWEKCLQKVGELPEYQFVINENDKLLEEAKVLRKEFITRIKNTIKN